jgi:hypothetical protein
MDLRAYIEERSIPEPMSGCWIWLRGYWPPSEPPRDMTTAAPLAPTATAVRLGDGARMKEAPMNT